MTVEKLRKITGLILLIKSFIMALVSAILIISGIALVIESKKPVEPAPEGTIDCSGLGQAIALIFGILFLIMAVVLVIVFIVYLINSRKILYADIYPRKSVIIMIIFEIFHIVLSIFTIVSMVTGELMPLVLVIAIIVVIQSFITTVLLIKLNDIRKVIE